MTSNFLLIDPEEGTSVLHALASPVRVRILKILRQKGPLNVNDIAGTLSLPQSSISANVQVLEEAGLIRTESRAARKGGQKICHSLIDEMLVTFEADSHPVDDRVIETAMPLGFLDPGRMRAGLIWFTRGSVEYQFPNNAKLLGSDVASLEVSMELSSEVPGTSANWPSDITISINGVEIATWTSPGDFGDKRGV